MAEQEACASAVTDALAAAGESTETAENNDVRGESLLLPLLQGLLGGGGERLLAGLGSAGADVVADVRRSLARLRAALTPPTEHPQARALLALADRLEDALDAADRLDGCKKKPRRRSRAARHTVGVTHEELAEARRQVDRDQLALAPEPAEPPTPPTPPASITSVISSEPPTPERKQSIDTADEEVSYHDAVAARHKLPPVAHSASYESAPKVNRDARVVERREPAPRKPDFYRHSMEDALPQQLPQPQHPIPQPPQPQLPQPRMDRRPSDSRHGIAKLANKFNAQIEKEMPPLRRVPSMTQQPVTAPTVQMKALPRQDPKRPPLYKPLPPSFNFAAPQPVEDFSKPLSRNAANKRSRMKRANTINIGEPLGGYRLDSDTDDENLEPRHGPAMPKFQPQTENDRKFLAFMQKNEDNRVVNSGGQTNWSNRFGNIKNTFENREREDNSRSSSTSSVKRFWQTADAPPQMSAMRPPRKSYGEINPPRINAPWTADRRDSHQPHYAPHNQFPPTPPAPMVPPTHPSVPQSPTKPHVVKPFVAKPIPVNQFSHAPMSAFKPPKKIMSPTSAPPHIWSPPSTNTMVSPTVENPPGYMISPRPIVPSPPVPNVPWAVTDHDKPKRVLSLAVNKFEGNKFGLRGAPPPPAPPLHRTYNPPTPVTYAPPPIQNYPVKAIPTQNNLAAPELVKKIDNQKQYDYTEQYSPKIDAQKLQIQFYEKQIRDKHRMPMLNGYHEAPGRQPPTPPAHAPQPAYTVTDYTPANVVSTFVPLQQTPDIEKAKVHKVDYLPDVVMNENNHYESSQYAASPTARKMPVSPYSPRGRGPHNGDATDGETTEHSSVVTRVMRGPVCGNATITAGVRTRSGEQPRPTAPPSASAAKNLKGVLEKLSSPKHEVIAQIEKKKRDTRNQVRPVSKPLVQNGHPSPPARAPSPPRSLPLIKYESVPISPAGSPRSPAIAASRESVFSSESASRGSTPSALSKSESWHQITERVAQSRSPRRVVSRTKSMHLLSVPKLFEGGIARNELTEKKKTVEAYFSGQTASGKSTRARSPGASQTASVKARKVTNKQTASFSLGRSRTMPSVSELQFLDESNADDAFEDLVSALA